MVFAYNLILPIFLFGSVFSLACLLIYTPKPSFLSLSPNLSRESAEPTLLRRSKLLSANEIFIGERGQFLLNDSIEVISLKGQSYQLACDLSDAPKASLRGQSYQLACRFSDIPQAYLQGQSYHLACDLSEAPESALCGQFYPFASIFKQTWHDFYRSNLGKPNVDYWQWSNYPEVKNICRELTLLVELPAPKKYDREILESLATGTNLFLFGSNGRELDFNAKFALRSPQLQQRMRQSFRRWHDTSCNLLGRETMQAIYHVCYRTDWGRIIEAIENSADFRIDDRSAWWEVLGVSKTADSIEVEIAYKKSIRMWHPDLNPHPDATKITASINIAYEKYQAIKPPTPRNISDRDNKLNLKIFYKLQDWLKPIFPR